ncbi:hypothetical protein [Rhizobium sp. ICMP 5592]|uniref:hypothetical protein n=1 Tax=Rhizobium sp. ICMP 5592 TaxID=2292445 RepID=UPI0012980B23|nr:hypothetical protein [Rhizobium sp. ICMP 5592]MQB43373.1 hypothetical protein [Rhizobium sp. ICMP 5592]
MKKCRQVLDRKKAAQRRKLTLARLAMVSQARLAWPAQIRSATPEQRARMSGTMAQWLIRARRWQLPSLAAVAATMGRR